MKETVSCSSVCVSVVHSGHFSSSCSVNALRLSGFVEVNVVFRRDQYGAEEEGEEEVVCLDEMKGFLP